MTVSAFRPLACTAVALAGSLAIPAPAFGQTQGAAEAAWAELSAQEQTRAGDPDFDYQLGIAALDTGRFGAAIIAFQRVLAAQPAHAQARAELARAYAMAGDADTARASTI